MVGSILRIRYEIIKELYQAPLFIAYEARDRVAGRQVCLRMIRSEFSSSLDFKAKLKSIVSTMCGLKHPQIEAVYGIEDFEDYLFIVSELLKGEPLSQHLAKHGSFSLGNALDISLDLCQALQFLQEQGGMAHGEVLPSNVIYLSDGTVKLILPGLWQCYSSNQSLALAVLPQIVSYLAPEIHFDVLPNTLSDIYSFGVLLFELLTGQKPFLSDSVEKTAKQHRAAPIPNASAYASSVPQPLDEVIKRILAKNPNERYSSFYVLIQDIKAIRSALKIGRSMAVKKEALVEAPPELPRVAPKMEALQYENKKLRKNRQLTSNSKNSVPAWLLSLVYSGVILMFVLLGGWIFFSMSQPKLVQVPDILGLDIPGAHERLNELDLGLKVSKRVANEQYPEGSIIEVNPNPGQSVRQNSHVYVIVSAGTRFVEVPDLRGRSVDEAESILKTLSLELDRPPQIQYLRGIEFGKIVSHLPERGSKVERFSKIRAKISGPLVRQNQKRASSEKHVYRVKVRLPRGKLPVIVRVDMTDSRQTKTIYESIHRSGEDFQVESTGYGRDAIFRIFYDGELVKQVYQEVQPASEENLNRGSFNEDSAPTDQEIFSTRMQNQQGGNE